MKLIIAKEYVNYNDAMKWFDGIKQGDIDEKIFVLEHEDVYTAGKSVLNNENEAVLDAIYNIPVVYTSRGGLWTWHGKGQVVVYFVYNLRKRRMFLSNFLQLVEQATLDIVEQEIFDLCNVNSANLGLKFYADEDRRGFWIKQNDVDDNAKMKIAKFGFIGLRVSNGFVFHGISINYNNNLEFFNYINPCGLGDVKITSIEEIVKCSKKKHNHLDINNFKFHLGNSLFKTLNINLV